MTGYQDEWAVDRPWGDVSLKVIAGGLVGELAVALEGLLTGTLSWEAAVAVALTGLAAYLKRDRVADSSLSRPKRRRKR